MTPNTTHMTVLNIYDRYSVPVTGARTVPVINVVKWLRLG